MTDREPELPPSPSPAEGLAALERRVRLDLDLLDESGAVRASAEGWVGARRDGEGRPVADVVVLGAGMCGLVAAFALRRHGIARVRLLDAAPRGREGPWVTYARMRTLRSPKHLAGPALGLPSLTFRAWFEAQWGAHAWARLGRIPRTQWMDYLRWYRRVLALPVENEVRAVALAPDPRGLRVSLDAPTGHDTVVARKVVLATGREGLARRRVPEALSSLPPDRCQHSAEAIDLAALRGRRVAVIGLGASAFDNAAVALETGAAEVWMLARAASVPVVNKAKSTVYAGFIHGYPELPPAERFRTLTYMFRSRVAPPRDSVLRVSSDPRLRLRLASPVEAARVDGGDIVLDTPRDTIRVDHVIMATGFRVDLAATPLLAPHAAAIARWRDLLAADDDRVGDEFLDFPDLGDGFELRERVPGAAPWLGDVHCFNFAAALSLGNVSSDIPAVSQGAERLARGIARDLFLADREHHWAALQAYADPEIPPEDVPAER